MLPCPYCNQSVNESAQACPHCDFSLDSLSKILGSPPKLDFHFHDFTKSVRPGEASKIRKLIRLNRIHRPNNGYHLVISNFLDERIPLSLHGFWFLNRGGICAPVDTGGACYDLLVLINPAHQRAALCAGYAIEYLIDQETLDDVLASQGHAIAQGRYYEAMEGIMHQMNTHLDNMVMRNKTALLPLSKGERIISIDGETIPRPADEKPRPAPY